MKLKLELRIADFAIRHSPSATGHSESAIRRVWGSLMTAFLMLSSSFTFPVMSQAPSGSHLRLLRSGGGAIELELAVDGFHMETVEHQGQTYERLIIPDMAQTATPGNPQVPTRGALLGVPSTQKVSVQVLEANYEMLEGYRLYPAPELKVTADKIDNLMDGGVQPTWSIDHAVYSTDAFYPGRLVEIGQTGYLRDQPVAQVQFYPVQYNPVTSQVRLYRRLLVQVRWEPTRQEKSEIRRWVSPAYEKLLSHTVLNYEALNRPSQALFEGNSKLEYRNPKQIQMTQIRNPQSAIRNQATLALKIGVVEDGLYQLTYRDLADAGFDLSQVDPRTIKITNRGAEIPLYVQGDSDGVFNPADYILFYGTAIKGDIYTFKNVYWLTAGGSAGRRMSARDAAPSGNATVPTHFPATLHAEVNDYYWQTMPNGEGQDHYFWGDPLIAPESREYTVNLSHISTTASAVTVRVRLKGRSQDRSIDPDHHTRISLNNITMDDQRWDGQINYDHVVVVPHSSLREGNNFIQVEAVEDTAAFVDQVLVNWIEIEYWHTYVADNDQLNFRAPKAGRFQFEVTGFSRPEVQVFDVTDPANVVLIANTSVVNDVGTYTLRFEDTAQPETRYLALTPTARQSPAGFQVDQPSSWKSPNHGADYIIITPEEFYTSSLRLANHRSASGLRVVTVKVEDIYDEFNDGIFNPRAIRDFLSYAYHYWVGPPPTYVLLVGDATNDYKDNLKTGTVNYVPSQIVQTEVLGDTPSDNWFVLVSGDDILPDMFIGRLSAQTRSEVDAIVDKIIRYEENPPDEPWSKKVLLVADDDSVIFEAISERLASLLPSGYMPDKIYVSHYPPGDPTVDIINAITGGRLLVQYAGHGNANRWGLWDNNRRFIFDQSDLTSLKNIKTWPVVAVADCVNGYFTGPQTQVCMAEAFLRLRGTGAVAVWAPAHFDYPFGHAVLMEAFYQAIFQDGQRSLGAATTTAKVAAYAESSSWRELVECYVLFGDPAMPIGP